MRGGKNRLAALAILVAAASIALAGWGGSSSPRPHVANLAKSGISAVDSGHRSSAITLPKGSPSRLLDKWAACERSHGDVNQAAPTIDAHGVIHVHTPMPNLGGPGATGSPHAVAIAGDPHDLTGSCSSYLAAAQRVLSHGQPRAWAGGRDLATIVKYVDCMRANGVPNYPYPSGQYESGGNPTTNFNGTGVDPKSPFVVKISIKCGDKLGAPLWWSAGWGPPGDVVVQPTLPRGVLRPAELVPVDRGSRVGR